MSKPVQSMAACTFCILACGGRNHAGSSWSYVLGQVPIHGRPRARTVSGTLHERSCACGVRVTSNHRPHCHQQEVQPGRYVPREPNDRCAFKAGSRSRTSSGALRISRSRGSTRRNLDAGVSENTEGCSNSRLARLPAGQAGIPANWYEMTSASALAGRLATRRKLRRRKARNPIGKKTGCSEPSGQRCPRRRCMLNYQQPHKAAELNAPCFRGSSSKIRWCQNS